MNIEYAGAPYSPEQLIAMLDEFGADHPKFKVAYGAFEAWEDGQTRTAPAAAAMTRQAMMEIIANDEAELASMLPDAMPPKHFEPRPDVPTVQEASAAPKRPKPCPAVSDITMIQTTLWDNWGSEKRPKSGDYKNRVPLNRFGCDIEVWIDAGATIVNLADLKKKLAFRSRTDLIRWHDFGAVVPKLVAAGKVSVEYGDELLALHAVSVPTYCFGLFSGKGAAKGSKGGGAYIPRTFARVEMIGPMPGAADIWVDGQRLKIEGWTDRTPGGDFLSPYRASRMDIEGSYGWNGWDSRV